MSWFIKVHVDRRVHSQSDTWTFRQTLYVYSLWQRISVRVFTQQESLGRSSLVSSFPNKLSWTADGVSAAASWKKIVCFFKMLICSKEKQVMDKFSASCPLIGWHCVSLWSLFTVRQWSWGQDQSADPTCSKLFTQIISLFASYLRSKLICTVFIMAYTCRFLICSQGKHIMISRQSLLRRAWCFPAGSDRQPHL